MTSRSRLESKSSSLSSTCAGVEPNASSTKPARRGENAASPLATRSMAATRSDGAMALVTYPRAPARITLTTSSAASETLRAKKRVELTSAQSRTTWAPPEPLPPGRCTSSSTTSGFRAWTAAIAPGTSSASPTTVIRCGTRSSWARTPARIRAWSSTSRTLRGSAM